MLIDVLKIKELELYDIDYTISLEQLKGFQDEQYLTPLTVKGTYMLMEDDSVYIDCKATGEVTLVCNYCLDEFKYNIKINCKEVVAKQDTDYLISEENYIDLNEIIREKLILTLLDQNKCKSDCKGLCQGCGVNLNHENCKCDTSKTEGENNPFAKLLEKYSGGAKNGSTKA